MPVIVKQDFALHPEGQFLAVLVDVIDKGIVEYEYNKETKSARKGSLVFQSSELMKDGRPFLVYYNCTLSVGDKANLRKFLEQWFNRKLTKDEVRDGVDLESYIGQNGIIQVVHSEDGRFANINGIMQPMKGMELLKPRDYVRRIEREAPPSVDEVLEEEDDLPF